MLRNDYGYYPRPDGFDGNAEKLSYGNGDCVWWQPHSDGPKRGTPEFEQERKHVRDLLEFGMCGFILELLEGKDAYRQPIVTKVASLWGIEPFPEPVDCSGVMSYTALLMILAEHLGYGIA